jgi:hypothetical protein
MFCPMKFTCTNKGALATPSESYKGDAQCEGEHCTWWYKGHCAIRSIAIDLDDIAQAAVDYHQLHGV